MSEQSRDDFLKERMVRIVERLFGRLTTKYGRAFMAQYEGVEAQAVAADWAYELRDYNSPKGGEIIAWALDNLPERIPNSIQFHNLCRTAPIDRSDALPAPDGIPMTDEQRQALRSVVEATAKPKPMGKDLSWARAIMGRIEAGNPPCAAAQRMAREALGVKQ